MNNIKRRQPIPWEHRSSALISTWTWDTPHFSVSIFSEGLMAKKLYNWKIVDKTSGTPKTFDSDTDVSFTKAVDVVLEIIAKSYARELGYQEYAGELATTYTIGDGKRYDFASMIGESVIVKALDENNEEQLYTGLFDLKNYDFIISNNNMGTVIPPVRVQDVMKEFGMTSLIDKNKTSQLATSKNKRIIQEEWRKGCTGSPGYRPNTVIHGPGDEYCPLHGV